MSRIVSLRRAIAAVPSGSTVTCGGFQLNRAPMALVRELIRQRKRGLQLFLLPNPLPLDYLVGAGAVAFADVAFAGMELGRRSLVPPNWRRAVEGGKLRWRERDALYLVQALRAAALGVPFLPLPVRNGAPQGDDVARLRDPFTGGRVAVVRAFRPQIALVHAQAADRAGNLWIDDPVTDLLVIRASRMVVATAEEIVPRLPRVNVPSVWVRSVACVPGGAWPTACPNRYSQDESQLERYVAVSRSGGFSDYLRKHLGRSERPRAWLQ